MIDRTESGRRLRAARESSGLNQSEAAASLGMAQPYLSDIESGRRVPSWPRVLAMVEALGLDPRIVAPEFFADDATDEAGREASQGPPSAAPRIHPGT